MDREVPLWGNKGKGVGDIAVILGWGREGDGAIMG